MVYSIEFDLLLTMNFIVMQLSDKAVASGPAGPVLAGPLFRGR